MIDLIYFFRKMFARHHQIVQFSYIRDAQNCKTTESGHVSLLMKPVIASVILRERAQLAGGCIVCLSVTYCGQVDNLGHDILVTSQHVAPVVGRSSAIFCLLYFCQAHLSFRLF